MRLENYDYSSEGAYFITICTKDRKKLFGDFVGANCVRPQNILLSELGEFVFNELNRWETIYDNIVLDKFVIMPDHIHLIVFITSGNGRTQFAPTISRIIKQFKSIVSKHAGFSLWQKSYFDHIIRNQTDYLEIWEYIDSNPEKLQDITK